MQRNQLNACLVVMHLPVNAGKEVLGPIHFSLYHGLDDTSRSKSILLGFRLWIEPWAVGRAVVPSGGHNRNFLKMHVVLTFQASLLTILDINIQDTWMGF